MSNLLNKYFNAKTFCLSYSLWEDEDLTTLSPDGIYTDGTIVREQVGGVLTAANQVDCPTCLSACAGFLENGAEAETYKPPLSATIVPAQAGTYEVSSNLGDTLEETGAIILRVYLRSDPANPLADVSAPVGMRAWIEDQGIITLRTNMFSGSGTTVVSGDAANGQTVINGPDGTVGATKNINNTALTGDLLPVYVGRCNDATSLACFSSINIGAPAACGGGLTLPNNTPFTGGTAAASVTYTGLPKYTWTWQVGGTPGSFSVDGTQNIDVADSQVQVGGAGGTLNAACTPAGEGFRGWLTAVIPKTSPLQNKVAVEITNTMCQGGAVVQISCAKFLSPIECSAPMSTLEQACLASDMSTTVYNVPGASGTSNALVWNTVEPAYVFPAGKPNLGDIICSSQEGEPLSLAQKDKYYKYTDDTGPCVFYVNEYGVVSDTKLSCTAQVPADFDFTYQVADGGIGGGLYRTTWEVPTGSTGAVILRVLTGNNPKGLIASHYDADNNLLGKTNMFSVRGAKADQVLDQQSYEARIDSTGGELLLYIQAGGIRGGSSLTLGGKGVPAGNSYVPNFAEEEGWPPADSADKWWGMLQSTATIYDYTFGCQIFGGDTNTAGDNINNSPYPCTIFCSQLDYNENQATIDTPVYIGLSNFSGSAIPCTSQVNLQFLNNPLACSPNCFNPEGGGALNDSNIYGIINLPPNGNHGGTNIAGIGPQLVGSGNPPIPEGLFLKTNYCDFIPGANNPGFGLQEIVPDGVFPFFTRFPDNTTSCSDGFYNLWTLTGAGSYVNIQSARRFYITPAQVQLYSAIEDGANTPGWSMAVIPLTGVLGANEIIDLDIYVPSSNTNFAVYADAPAALPQTNISGVALTLYGPYTITQNNAGAGGIVNACATGAIIAADAIVPYIAKNAFGGQAGPCIPGNANVSNTPCSAQATMSIIPRINDILFQDANGETKLSTGRYYFATGGAPADRNVIEVDQFGVVTCVSKCGAVDTIGQCGVYSF